MNKKKNAILLILLLIITLIPIGFSAWVLTDKTDFAPEFNQALPTSTLTKEIDAATSDMYIYTSRATSGTDVVDYYLEDDLEDYKVSFPNIEGYAEYIPTGGTIPEFGNQTTYLGYNNSTLEIDHNVRFTHEESKIDYTYTNYNNRVFSTPDSYGNGTYCYYLDSSDSNSYYYYTSVTNKNNDTKTYNAKVNKWINYYYYNNSLSVTDYKTGSAVKYSGTVLSKRLYTVKLVGDVLLKSGCSLDIGAFVGCVASAYSGPSIQGYFVVLDLNGHTLTIENGATLNAWGYIIDSKVNKNGEHIGKIINRGTIYTSYIIEDYGGGGPTTAIGAHGTTPFNIYSLPYLSCKTIFEYGSSLINPCSLYASNQFNISTVTFVGTSSNSAFIQLSSGATLMIDSYNDPEKLKTAALYTKNYRSKIEFNGDISVTTAKLSITVASITQVINMAELGFVITPYMDVVVNSGNLTLKLLVDCLPGSSVFVDEEATIIFDQLNISSDESIFDEASTSYGGLRVPSLLPSDTSTCYAGHYYSVSVASNFNNYLKAESILNEAGSTDARVNIEGDIYVNNINVSNTVIAYTNSIGKYVLAGKINLSESAEEYLINNKSYFCTLSTDYEMSAYISSSDLAKAIASTLFGGNKAESIRDNSSQVTHTSYTVLPLVSNGKVFNAPALYSSFDNNTYYDFTDGVYVCGSDNYIRLNNNTAGDLTGSFVKITEWNKDAHYVKYNNKVYSYFRNMFVENATAADDNIYVKDDYYGDNATKTFNAIDFTNNNVNYTYKYNASSSLINDNYILTRSRSRSKWYNSWGSYSIDQTTWDNYQNNPLQYYANWTPSSSSSSNEETVNYDLVSFITSNYTYSYTYSGIKYDYGSLVDYKNNILYSMVRRPFDGTKFNQALTNTYHKMGTLKLSYSWDDKTEEKISYSVSTVTETGGGVFDTSHTQSVTITIITANNDIVKGSLTFSGRSMYYMTNYSSAIRFVSDCGMWIKNTYTG